MYSILIVDDERLIRNGIRDLIPWKQLNIDKTYTAESASQALDILREHHVDILLTDICMPETTGLEMIQEITVEERPLRTIVLTGYNDFEYAQQCCKMDVHDFLLKPICEDELTEAIQKQVQILNEFYEQEQLHKIINRVTEMDDGIRLERSLAKLAHNESSLEEIQEILQQYGYSSHQPVQIALVVPHLQGNGDWQEENELQLLSIKNVFLELVDAQHFGITFMDKGWQLGVVFFADNDLFDPYSQLELITTRLIYDINAAPRVALGSVVASFADLSVSYNDATRLLKQSTKASYEKIQQLPDIEKKMQGFYLEFSNLREYLRSNISNEDNLHTGLKAMEALFEEYNLTLPFLRLCCYEVICSTYYAYILENGGEPDDRLSTIMHSLQTSSRQTALSITSDCILHLFSPDSEESNKLIQAAKRYIKEHLAEDLNVSSVAAQLFINANYFSRLFKKETGEGCSEYITRKRIEKAKVLLETTSLKTGHIADEVGYRDKNYFSLAFKKMTGTSPTSYRAETRQS